MQSHELLQRQPEGNYVQSPRGVTRTCLHWLIVWVSDKQRSSIQSNREAEILLQYQVLYDGFGLRLSCPRVPGVIACKSEKQIEKGIDDSFLAA